jgi:hypothetical protein
MALIKNGTRTKILLSILLILLAAYYFYARSLQGGMTMEKQNIFLSTNPAIDFTFEYPKEGWTLTEAQGRKEKYDAVYLRGPLNNEKRFVTLIELVVKPLETGQTVSELLDSFLARVNRLPKFKLIYKKNINVGGSQAASAAYETEARLPMYTLHSQPTRIEERTVFLTKGQKAYRISFHVLAVQARVYQPAFERVLKTFRFKN